MNDATSARSRAIVAIALPVLASVAVFAALEPVLRGLARLPPEAYERPLILSAIPTRLWGLLQGRPLVGLLGALAIGGASVFPGARRKIVKSFDDWSTIDEGSALRILVGFIAGLGTWTFSMYAYNAYAGQAHLGDRAALVGLWILVLWRPIFLLPFAVVLATIAGQLDVPLGVHSWTEVELLIRVPILFTSYWFVRSATGSRDSSPFMIGLFAVLAVTYWASGLGKLQTGWLAYPHLDWLLVGAHATGWLGSFDATTISEMARAVRGLSLPLMFLTMVGECAAVILLWRRATLLGLLGFWILFHLGAFILTGIFFWKWMALELALLVFLLHRHRIDRLALFSRTRFMLFAGLVFGNSLWIEAVNLTWYDTPLTYSLRFEGVGASGRTYDLPYRSFRPYADSFVIGSFDDLSPYPRLTGAMGVTQDRSVADLLAAARDTAEVFELERRLGTRRFDPQRSSRFDEFVARYARYLNERDGRPAMLPSPLRPPRHLWTSPRGPVWAGEEDLDRIRVVEHTTFIEDGVPRVVRTRPLRTIDVASGRAVVAPTATATRQGLSAAS